MHYAICETYSVQWSSIHLWSIEGGGRSVCHEPYVVIVVFHRSMVNWRGGGVSLS